MYPFKCNDCRFKDTCLLSMVGKDIDTSHLNNTKVHYLRHQTLCKEGEFSSSMKLIIEGLVMMVNEGPDKRNIIVNIVIIFILSISIL